ncbi:telomere-associated protein Tap [Streptomyces niveus]|uniref:telomere-associated protein Tap n=1 Tax=Streptomyces niveus TaxID=193462 RepID=UPI00386E7AF1
MFDAVDALVASLSSLPSAEERKRLRAAHGLTLDDVAGALKVRRATVSAWESTKKPTEPRGPEREAYARLLKQLAEFYPAPATPEASAAAPVPETFTGGPTRRAKCQRFRTDALIDQVVEGLAPAPAAAPVAASRPASTTRPPTSRRPGARKAAPANTPADVTDPRFENGPLAVVDVEDGQVLAYCTGGLVLDVPAKSVPALVDWTLSEAKLGAPKLSGPGKPADPLLVLTEAALERYGLPATLTEEERLAGRLPENHKVIKQLVRAEWKLTKRGFGPWARIYRPAQGSERACVQPCIPSWQALDTRHWGEAGQLPPAELARLLCTYAVRVMTPRGSTAVTGLELMTALHPATRASEPDADGKRHSEHNPGSLWKDPVNCAPCEAPDGHPLLADLPRFHLRGPGEKLFEEAYDWARPLTDDECLHRNLVVIDVNVAFAAGANGLRVGLAGQPTHAPRLVAGRPVPRRPVPCEGWQGQVGGTGSQPAAEPVHTEGRPAAGAWYATPTVAYAAELGYDVTPVEAWVRYDNGRYLDGWYNRLRDAYLATMADFGVGADLSPEDFLAAMDGYRSRDPQLAIVVSAIKATVTSARAVRAGSRPAVARPVEADVAAGHPRRGHLPHSHQPAPQDREARGVHRAVPGRDPLRLRRVRGRRREPAGLFALPGGQATARRLQARSQPRPREARGHPERAVGRRGTGAVQRPRARPRPVHL